MVHGRAKRYRTPAGKDVVEEFLSEIPSVARSIGDQVIEMLETGEIQSRPRHVDNLGDGVRELRWSYQNVQYRLTFAELDGRVWLLSGFIKKTEKTPRRELQLAKRRLREIAREQGR